LEQPAEPEDSTFKDRVQHPAYQAQEIGGFIFAYIGPEPAPLLPNYDLFLREDGEREVGAGHDYCNWLQRAENSVDQTHLVALHASEYPHLALKRPVIGWERRDYGAKISMQVPGISKPKFSHWIFPSHTRHTTARKGRKPDHAIRFRVPMDDTNTMTFWLRFYPYGEEDRSKPFLLKTLGFGRTIKRESTNELTMAGGVLRHTTRIAWRKRARGPFMTEPRNISAHRTKASLCCEP